MSDDAVEKSWPWPAATGFHKDGEIVDRLQSMSRHCESRWRRADEGRRDHPPHLARGRAQAAGLAFEPAARQPWLHFHLERRDPCSAAARKARFSFFLPQNNTRARRRPQQQSLMLGWMNVWPYGVCVFASVIFTS